MVGLRSVGTSLLFSSPSPKTAVINPSNHVKIPPVVYHVYIMASQSGVLYIGMTNNLLHRVSQHKSKTIPGFSQTYNTTKLIYFEPFQDVRNAIAREKQLKRWNRSKKIFLIEKQNPTWQDLSPTLIPTQK